MIAANSTLAGVNYTLGIKRAHLMQIASPSAFNFRKDSLGVLAIFYPPSVSNLFLLSLTISI